MIEKNVLKWTVSNLFILPILKIDRSRLQKVGFINSFLFNHEEEIQYENCINLLFSPPDLEDFNLFLFEERERGMKIIDEKDYPNNLVLVTYKLPLEFKEDFDKIWQGKYSRLSKTYREFMPNSVHYHRKGQEIEEKTLQNLIMDKDSRLRKQWEDYFNTVMDDSQELWKLPTVESETFKKSDYELSTESSERT